VVRTKLILPSLPGKAASAGFTTATTNAAMHAATNASTTVAVRTTVLLTPIHPSLVGRRKKGVQDPRPYLLHSTLSIEGVGVRAHPPYGASFLLLGRCPRLRTSENAHSRHFGE